jgi:hypothetical protein
MQIIRVKCYKTTHKRIQCNHLEIQGVIKLLTVIMELILPLISQIVVVVVVAAAATV